MCLLQIEQLETSEGEKDEGDKEKLSDENIGLMKKLEDYEKQFKELERQCKADFVSHKPYLT